MGKHDLIFVNELPQNAKKVVLGYMVSSSSFWVTEPNEANMSEKRREFLVKEEILSMRCSNSKWCKDFFPKENEVVAVQHPLTDRWHRAKVIRICKLERTTLYHVFLLDYGTYIDVKEKSVRELPNYVKKVPPQAYQIELYGILPTTVDIDYEAMKMKRIICEMWCPASTAFVRELLRQCYGGYIVPKKTSKSHRRLYVDLYLCLNDGYINLGEELCDKEYAVFEVQLFDDLIQCGLNDSTSGNESDLLSQNMDDELDSELLNDSSTKLKSSPPSDHKVLEPTPDSTFKFGSVHQTESSRKQQVFENLVEFLKEHSKNKNVHDNKQAFTHCKKEGDAFDECSDINIRGANLIHSTFNLCSILNDAESAHFLPTTSVDNNKDDFLPNGLKKMQSDSLEQFKVCDSSNENVQASKLVSTTTTNNNNNNISSCKNNTNNNSSNNLLKFFEKSIKEKQVSSGTHSVTHTEKYSKEDTCSSAQGVPVTNTLKKSEIMSIKGHVSSSTERTEEEKTLHKVISSLQNMDACNFAQVKLETDAIPTNEVEFKNSDMTYFAHNFKDKNTVLTVTSKLETMDISRSSQVALETDAMKNSHIECAQKCEEEVAMPTAMSRLETAATSSYVQVDSVTDVIKKVEAGSKENDSSSPAQKCDNNITVHTVVSGQETVASCSCKQNITLTDVITRSNEECRETEETPQKLKCDEITVPAVTKEEPVSVGESAKKERSKSSLLNFLLQNVCAEKQLNCEENTLSVQNDKSCYEIPSEPKNTDDQVPDRSVEMFEPEQVIIPEVVNDCFKFKMPKPTAISERLLMNTIMVHGQHKTLKPIPTITSANFPKEIHEALFKLGIKDPMRIQTYVWPAILRGYSVIMVNPAKSGKTLAYLIPLISFLFHKKLYDGLPVGNGPVTMVICSSSKSAQWAANVCNQIAIDRSQCRVIVTYGGGADNTKLNDLINGCDILISTPKCLLRLMQKGPLIINFSRLCHLVLDEADILTFRFLPEIKIILSECKKTLRKRSSSLLASLQVIASSEKWCSPLESFAHNITTNPVICIGSYLEAAVYAKLKPNLHFVRKTDRKQKVIDILGNNIGLYKVVITAECAQDVEELGTALKSIYKNVLIANEHTPHFYIEDIYKEWTFMAVPGLYPILVCSDDVLFDLKIKDALWLIHYDLPNESKSTFGFRFSCLMNNYKDILTKNESLHPDCVVHILMGEENSKQLPTIVQLMKRLGASVSYDLEAASAAIVRKKDEDKVNMPLCYNIKAFGACWDLSQCTNRHVVIPEKDSPGNLPINGNVKFKILYVHDATHYSVRLLEHYDLNGTKHNLTSDFVKNDFYINLYYQDESNRLCHGIPCINDICAVEMEQNIYKRVIILSIENTDNGANPTEVGVKYLDIGQNEICKVSRLLHLPEKFRNITPQAVDVFLCHLAPCDLDWYWSHAANMKALEWLSNVVDKEGAFMIGKILLSLSSTLWLDPFECHQQLPILKATSVLLSLRKKIVENGLAVENPRHLSLLYTLCKEGGLDLPHDITENQLCHGEQNENVEPQWAYISEKDTVKISFFSANSPSQFFIRNFKLEESYWKLQNDLQKSTIEGELHLSLKPGDYCIGKFPQDDMWYRAKVLAIDDKIYELYFVDCGDTAKVTKENVATMSKELIDRLPFQAVECELVGLLKISETNWLNEATDLFYKFMYTEDTGTLKDIQIKVCEKKEFGGVMTGGHKYKVIVICEEDTEEPVINKKLIKYGVALLNENEKHILECYSLTKSLPVIAGTKNGSEETTVNNSDDSDDNLKSPSDRDNSDTLMLIPCSTPVESEEKQLKLYDSRNDATKSLLDFNEFAIDDEDIKDFMDLIAKMHFAKNIFMPKDDAVESKDGVVEIDNDIVTDARANELDSQFEKPPESVENCLPALKTKTKIPQIRWHQNLLYVWLHIGLVGVEKYYLSCTEASLEFSTDQQGLYFFVLETFGTFNPHTVQHSAKGLYVEIKLEKILKGFHWPRLLKSGEKPSWLKLNYDFEEGESNICSNQIEEGVQIHKHKEEISCTKNLQGNEIIDNQEDYTSRKRLIIYDSDYSEELASADDFSEKEDNEVIENPFDPWIFNI